MRLRPLFVLCCLPLLGFNHAHAAAPLAQQRQLYDEASRALERNDPTPYLRNRAALDGYPLEAYLAYSELLSRLPNASDAEIEHFLNQHLRLIAEEPIDCRDLFDGDDEKEKILVYQVRSFL